ncbi:MAG: RNA polymerase factor sigma-32 [Desulfobacteraceae bacterium]|nr:RNA polymerase factor sigma-32 [Desulfobacteraceae bacterium]
MADRIKMKVNRGKGNLPALRLGRFDAVVSDETNPIQLYMSEIGHYPLLTKEEEERLAKLYYETHDPMAASRIVTANLRLVVKIALDFQKFWMQNFMDLVQEGSIGLMHAVKKFDPYKGVKFSYYASFWIKAYILKFIMDNWRLVKIGTTQAQRKLFYNLGKEKERLYALGFEPVPKLISESLGVPEEDVIGMEQRMGSWEVSLDAPMQENSDDSHMDFLPSHDPPIESAFAKKEMLAQLRKHLEDLRGTLKGKEKIIFEKRMLTDDPITLQELGEEFGVSRERIRQIESRVKKKIRQFLKDRVKDIESYNEGIEEA